MSSSMLFSANGRIPVYNSANPTKSPITYLSSGNNVRVTNIWDYNTTTGSVTEVQPNATPDGGNIIKMLRHEKGFSKKSDMTFIRDMNNDWASGTPVNKTTYSTKKTDLLYGADSRAPIKSQIGVGVLMNVTKHKNGYYFVMAANTSGWVKASDINFQYKIEIKDSDIKYNDITDGTADDKQLAEREKAVGKRIKAGKFFKLDSDITALLNSAGIYNRRQIEWYDKFDRFGAIDPYNNVTTTKEYIFFTKPDLHIFDNKDDGSLNPELKNVPIFNDAMKRYKPVMRELQWSAKCNTSKPFINLLSNSIKSNLELPSISAGEIETSANIYGTSLSYRTGSGSSDAAFDFTLEFEDTKYLEVYMFFKLFDEYERRKYYGDITPPDVLYRFRKRLHDQISIYKFVVGEDGETLIYWAKLFGCYPKEFPEKHFLICLLVAD